MQRFIVVDKFVSLQSLPNAPFCSDVALVCANSGNWTYRPEVFKHFYTATQALSHRGTLPPNYVPRKFCLKDITKTKIFPLQKCIFHPQN